jgi:hypothetical protein
MTDRPPLSDTTRMEPYTPTEDGYYWVIDPDGHLDDGVAMLFGGVWLTAGDELWLTHLKAISPRLEEPE